MDDFENPRVRRMRGLPPLVKDVADDELGPGPGAPPPGPRFAIPAGTPEASCRGCGAAIFWIVTAKGKRMPVRPDGRSHFADCPAASRFRRPKPKTPPETP